MSADRDKDGLISGSAILGFYAAIKICRRDGYDPRGVFELVLKHVEETQCTNAKSAADPTPAPINAQTAGTTKGSQTS